jgi:hypothetical protein
VTLGVSLPGDVARDLDHVQGFRTRSALVSAALPEHKSSQLSSANNIYIELERPKLQYPSILFTCWLRHRKLGVARSAAKAAQQRTGLKMLLKVHSSTSAGIEADQESTVPTLK